MLNIGPDADLAEDFLLLKRDYVESNKNLSTYSDEDVDEDTKMFNDEKVRKKKKKKKKTRFVDDRLDFILGDPDDDDPDADFLTGDDIISFKKPTKGKKNIFDTKAAKKKRKKNIERKFSREIAGLRKVLADVEMTAADAREIFKAIKDSKSRYVGKTLVDLIAAINQSNSSRASILKEIANINKAIVDLQLKEAKDKKSKDDKEDHDPERHGISFFTKFFNTGDRNAIKDMAREYYSAEGDLDDVSVAEEDDYIENRLKTEDNKYRSEDGNAYIKYEAMKPEDVILYHQDGSWETAAIDHEGNLMPDDYPIIPKENLGKVRFMLDDLKAIDETARTWRVIEVD